ncbi:MAG: tetratricopeptide repeat protein [Promethearchaeota archaeon]|jgi:tetratricopeptide (TPR) repeat protein
MLGTVLDKVILPLFSWLFKRSKWGPGYKSAAFHLRRGEDLQERELYKEAREEIVKSVQILESEHRHKLLSEAYLRLGDIACKEENWEDAIHNYICCETSAKMVKNRISEDVIKLKLGNAYRGAGKLDDAFRCIDEARGIQEKTEDHPLLGGTYSKLAEIERSRGYDRAATDYLLKALTRQERIKDRKSQAGTRASLGALHAKKNNRDEALNHYRIARDLYREVGDTAIVDYLDSEIKKISA